MLRISDRRLALGLLLSFVLPAPAQQLVQRGPFNKPVQVFDKNRAVDQPTARRLER